MWLDLTRKQQGLSFLARSLMCPSTTSMTKAMISQLLWVCSHVETHFSLTLADLLIIRGCSHSSPLPKVQQICRRIYEDTHQISPVLRVY